MSYRNGNGYFKPGEAKQLIKQWLDNYPDETPFYYGTIADETGVQKPTVSADLLKRVRNAHPTLRVGGSSGWYEKITPAPQPETRAVTRSAPEKENGPVQGDLLEVSGIARDGDLLLRFEGLSDMWKATRI